MLSPNKFEQLTVGDAVKETANVEQHEDNPNNNPTRMTTEESYTIQANLNLTNYNRPTKIANSQT